MDSKKADAVIESEREEERQASDVDSPVFVKDRQSVPVNGREGVEHVETDSTVEKEDDVTPRPQNVDCIGVDNSDQPDDGNLNLTRNCQLLVRMTITQRMSCQTVELTVQVIPEIDSSVRGRPSRQRKPPSKYGTWVAGSPDCPVMLKVRQLQKFTRLNVVCFLRTVDIVMFINEHSLETQSVVSVSSCFKFTQK